KEEAIVAAATTSTSDEVTAGGMEAVAIAAEGEDIKEKENEREEAEARERDRRVAESLAIYRAQLKAQQAETTTATAREPP
ncbi:unnamed protein product, partial [Chrysoparadoxa australica]